MPRLLLASFVLLAVLAIPVARAEEARPVDFRTDAIAALSRAGCNQGSCHGSPQGKNGFRLSLRGHDPDLDLATLTRDALGSRIDLQRPENSLFLLKGTGRVPHLGGVVLRQSDLAYRILRRWVAEGCRDTGPSPVSQLEVTPARRRLPADAPEQQLRVKAHFKSGEVRDVTELAVFSVNDLEAASVSRGGLVRFRQTAEVSVLIRYLDQFTSARLTYVRTDPEIRLPGAEAGQRHRRIASSPASASCNCCRPRSRPTKSSCAASSST